ncbi:MAG TPA: MG2 domain-containing protein [Thermoanaerobaculia bacterium]|nr:MG2 domain-containing protein [Thermoanaerobaculia bacterium]
MIRSTPPRRRTRLAAALLSSPLVLLAAAAVLTPAGPSPAAASPTAAAPTVPAAAAASPATAPATLATPAGTAGSAAKASGPTRQQPARRAGHPVVVPDHFLRRWDPVTVFFDRDLGPARGGPEDDPGRWVKVTPRQPGAFRWLDAHTLQFTPAEPWPPLTRFSWTAGGTTTPLDTLMSPPTSMLPAAGAEGLEPVRTITLVFPEPLDVQALRRMLTIELRPLPGAAAEGVAEGSGGGQPAGAAPETARLLSGQDFQIKAQERSSRSDPAAYVVTLARPVPLGTRAVLHFRLSLAEEAHESALDLAFQTAERFRVTALGCPGAQAPIASAGSRYGREQALRCSREARQVSVEFSAPLAAELSPVAARNLVRFEPAVPGLKFTVSGRQLLASGDFNRDSLYRVWLAPAAGIADNKGRPLAVRGQSEVFVTFPQLSGFLRWTASQGIVERFGPRQLPLEGRGFERVDLRIYPVDPLDRSFWPFPDSPVALDESTRPPGPGEEPEPWQAADRGVSAASLARYLRALGSPPVSELVALPLRRAGGTARFGLDLAPQLARLSGPGAPGTYVVGIRRLDSRRRFYMRLQVTDLALTAVEETKAVTFAVTSLATAAPVPGATVRVEGTVNGTGAGARWETLFEGTTDAAGRVAWQAPGTGDRRRPVTVQRVTARLGQDVLALDAARPPDGYGDGQWRPRHDSWLAWTEQDLADRSPAPETLCHIFTERPVYRPEETVHIKGYLRLRDGGHLAPITDPGLVVVNGPGDLTWRLPVTVGAAGSFTHDFKQAKLPTGVYTANFEAKSGTAYGKVSFRMEAYRLPKFEVQLHAAEVVPLDREFKVGLTAQYYAGGRVTARPLAWRVTQFPYSWTPRRLSGFLYSSDGRFSRTDRFQSTPRLERQDTTDATGAASLVLNPAIEPTAQPRSYVVEATITGTDDQTVTAARAIVALPPFVLGLKVPRYVERATRIQPEVVVVGPDDKPLAGQAVTVRLLQRQWHSHLQASDFSDGVARYRTDVVDQKLAEVAVTSGAGPQPVALAIPRSGVYVVEVEARDRLGRTQVVAVDLYAGGEQPVTWTKPPAGAFNVVADKAEYRPGETAVLVLESPFQRGRALAVIEAPEGNTYEWLAIEGGAATFRLPIHGNYAPRLPVHFLLERGRVPGTAPQPGSAADLGKPATVAATSWLKVLPVDNRVEVKLAYPEKARPGQKIDVTIALADPQGKPVGGEATLWLVDQAVLALGREQRLDPLPDFITPVSSRLTIGDSRNLAFGFLPFAENPGGEVGEKEAGSLLDRVTVRRNFKPVPYWNPAIVIGPAGVAKVTVELPDDLTNFKLRAKVASGAERFGFGTGEIAVRLPVLVQPALPRFVRPGDRFKAVAIGRVVEGEGGAGVAEMRAAGVTLGGPARQELRWSAKDPARIEFPVTVPTPAMRTDGKPAATEVTFRFAVERTADHASDGAEVKLPLRDDRRRISIRLLKELAAGGSLELPPLPEPARPGSVRRSVLVSDQPALVRMAAGLDFLLEYPYGCTEQRLSRARAELALTRLRDLLQPAGAGGNAGNAGNAGDAGEAGDQARLRRDVADTLEWLGRAVGPDGLVAYWPGGGGYVSLTAWSLDFLVEAKAAGFAVDDKLWNTLSRSLEQSLRTDYGHFIDGESFAERSWALAALTAAGKAQPAYTAELARKAQFLDLEGVSEVLQALAKGGGPETGPAADAMVRRLWGGLVLRLYAGRQIYGGLQEGPGHAPASGLILPSETRTVAEMTRALARRDGADPRLATLVEALTTLGGDDGWGSTNANAAALLALSELLKPPFAGSQPRSVEVRLGKSSQTLTLGPKAPVVTALSTGEDAALAGAVTVAAGATPSAAPTPGAPGAAAPGAAAARPLVVRVETSYLPAADGAQVAPAAAGFVVSRELLAVRGEGVPPERLPLAAAGTTVHFAVGDVIEEHVQVVNPKERHYVAVAVPLAAGMEPLNPGLATAPPEAKARGALSLRPTYAAYLDDEVTFYYDTLPKGTFDFYFRTRATTEGSFQQPAARAEAMYDGAVHGNSAGARVEVTRQAAEK